MQQINLYQFLPKPIKSILDLKVLVLLFSIFLSVLMLNYFIDVGLKHYQIQQVADANKMLTLSRNQLVNLALKYPRSYTEPQFGASNKLLACKTKFSTYLAGFAEAIVPGVWLTDIKISSNGRDIDLQGHAMQAEQIQQFLSQLKRQMIFSTLDFELQELTAENDKLSFDLITKSTGSHV